MLTAHVQRRALGTVGPASPPHCGGGGEAAGALPASPLFLREGRPLTLAFAGFQLLLKEECISTYIFVASLNLLTPADP